MKAFRDLTDKEKGVILLALHNKQEVEWATPHPLEWVTVRELPLAAHLGSNVIVRIKPIARVIYVDMDKTIIYKTNCCPSRIKFIECLGE